MKVLYRISCLASLTLGLNACGDDDGSSTNPADAGSEETDDETDGTDPEETGATEPTDVGTESTDPASTEGTDPEATDVEATETDEPGDAGVSPEMGDAGDGSAPETDGGSEAMPAALLSIQTGVFELVGEPGDAGTAEASGVAQLLRTEAGDTIVQIQVTGLSPETQYGSHLHALPCDVNVGGGHYLIDPEADPGAANEIWPAFTTDAEGIGHGRATAVGHVVRGDAQSVVVHSPAGDKLLCADLVSDEDGPVTYEGEFAPFAAADATEDGVMGAVVMVVSEDGTQIQVELSGLDPDGEYSAHVHAMSCDITEANGHYKIDPSEADTVAENELWPEVVPDGDGAVSSELESDHVARGDALSVVVHRAGGKVLCADLMRTTSWPDAITVGSAEAFDIAAERDVGDLAAEATMVRSLSGETSAEIVVDGLAADSTYPIHVHNRPCDIANGGGHYVLDETVDGVVEENEIWLSLTTDGDGAAEQSASVVHTARPEAQSIVIHDGDGERLACIDLE